jgi:hypothetical protein
LDDIFRGVSNNIFILKHIGCQDCSWKMRFIFTQEKRKNWHGHMHNSAQTMNSCQISVFYLRAAKLFLCPSIPYFLAVPAPRELKLWRLALYLPGVRPEFLIRGQELLGLGPDPDPLQMEFFVSFLTKIFSNLVLLCSIPWKMKWMIILKILRKSNLYS